MIKVHETAFAKINLDLRVCGRRADGYHDLDSIVVFAEMGDHLTFEPGGGLILRIEGPFQDGLPDDDRNLVVRAAKALARMAGRGADAHITLEKVLPIASGLGGGSADAAATLRGLCKFWDLPLGLADLAPLAQSLGADVPVCLGSSSVRMQGIGDRLTAMPAPAGLPMVLVNPGKAVSTPDVFRNLTVFSGARDWASIDETGPEFRTKNVPLSQQTDQIFPETLTQSRGADAASPDPFEWIDALADSVNDLEAPAIRIAPMIHTALDAIQGQSGCAVARMSGSGATCFGLFEDATERERAVSVLSRAHPGWWIKGTEVR